MQKGEYIRRCTKCGATNREVKFYPYRKVCSICERERATEWREENPDKIAVYNKARWQQIKNDPERLAKERARYEARNAKRRKLYRESSDERYKQKERLRNYREKKRVETRVRTMEISEAPG